VVRRSGGANGGTQRGFDDFFGVVRADFLVDLGGHAAIEMKEQRGVQREDQAFVGGDVGTFLHGLSLNGEFFDGL